MKLSRMLTIYRAMSGLSQRALAAEVGVSTATLCRIEQGKTCDVNSLVKLLTWLTETDSVEEGNDG